MTREELKEHCERQVQQFERVEKIMPVTPNDWKRYEEHKLVLELLEQESILDKIRAKIDELIEFNKRMNYMGIVGGLALAKNVIDKYKAESEV